MRGYLLSISIPMLMFKEQKIIVIKTVIHLDRNFVQKPFKSLHILFTISEEGRSCFSKEKVMGLKTTSD